MSVSFVCRGDVSTFLLIAKAFKICFEVVEVRMLFCIHNMEIIAMDYAILCFCSLEDSFY